MPIALVTIGFFILALSGLEKIMIYLHFSDRIGDISILKEVVPGYIWGITNATFTSGVVLLLLGVSLFMWKYREKR